MQDKRQIFKTLASTAQGGSGPYGTREWRDSQAGPFWKAFFDLHVQNPNIEAIGLGVAALPQRNAKPLTQAVQPMFEVR